MKKLVVTGMLVCTGAGFGQLTFTANSNLGIPNGGGWGDQRACVDMNGDYRDDILTTSTSSITIQYQQANGSFVTSVYNHPALTYFPSWSQAVGDIDKNGFNDLVYGDGSGVSFMKANATGTAYTETYSSEYVFSQRSNFVDINNDGHLDAFVCHDVNPNVYYINDGSGNLTYHQGGIGDHSSGGNYGSIWVDYDNDGDIDCFIAKCRGGGDPASIDELHRNNGDGTFTNVAATAGIDLGYHQSWSSAWNDFDNDGDMDVLIGQSSGDGSKLMRNNGNGTFTDVTTGSGWDSNTSMSIEFVSFDFNNDGFTDVYNGNGQLMLNDGDMTFTANSSAVPFGPIADLNGDGFLDVRVGSTVYFNNGNSNNWIRINLKGIASNYNGIGARVEIYGAWGKQIRDVQSGTGFANMHTLNVHFGIGAATEIDSIKVKWPSGTIDVIENPAINAPVTIVEGADPLALIDVDGLQMSVFPNPVTTELHVENAQAIAIQRLEIITMKGETVLSKTENFEKIDVAHLPQGAYVLLLHAKDGNSYSESFVKE